VKSKNFRRDNFVSQSKTANSVSKRQKTFGIILLPTWQ